MWREWGLKVDVLFKIKTICQHGITIEETTRPNILISEIVYFAPIAFVRTLSPSHCCVLIRISFFLPSSSSSNHSITLSSASYLYTNMIYPSWCVLITTINNYIVSPISLTRIVFALHWKETTHITSLLNNVCGPKSNPGLQFIVNNKAQSMIFSPFITILYMVISSSDG